MPNPPVLEYYRPESTKDEIIQISLDNLEKVKSYINSLRATIKCLRGTQTGEKDVK